MLEGLSTEEMRQQFNIINDFDPAEESRLRKESEWARGLPQLAV
jgi:S-phase kinase-associated protein 1